MVDSSVPRLMNQGLLRPTGGSGLWAEPIKNDLIMYKIIFMRIF